MIKNLSPLFSSFLCAGLLFSSTVQAEQTPEQTAPKPPSLAKQVEGLLKKKPQLFDKAIQNYIENHPDIIYGALVKYQQQQSQKQKDSVTSYMKENAKILFEDNKDGVLGNPNGNTTILVLSDYNCGYCRKAATALDEAIKTNPDLKVIIKQLPILGPDSNNAARVAMLAQQKHMFKKVNQALLSMDKPMSKDKLIATVGKLGISQTEVEKAFSSSDFDSDIKQNYALAAKLMIQGTPALIITNKDHSKIQFIDNYLDQVELKRAINSVK